VEDFDTTLQDHGKVTERLFEINQDLEHLSKDVNTFLIRKMVKLIIPENLKYQAKHKCVDKGGKNLRNKEEIIDLCCDIKEVLNIEYSQRQKERMHNGNGLGGSTQNKRFPEEREKRDAAPC
jgi:hypothetical protein